MDPFSFFCFAIAFAFQAACAAPAVIWGQSDDDNHETYFAG